MIAQLKKETAIGVHAQLTHCHTHYKYICLLEISTRGTDFLVDPLSPELHIPKGAPASTSSPMYQLNEVFTDLHIIKVMHNGTSDIPSLQHTFSVNVVGMFNTYRAAHVLGFPRIDLQYLLQRFCLYPGDSFCLPEGEHYIAPGYGYADSTILLKRQLQHSDFRGRP